MSETRMSCVLLADRHHGLTESLRGLLETTFRSVVMVADEESLLEAAARLLPEMTIVDLSLARSSNLRWLRTLRRRCPELHVVVLTVHGEESVRRAAIEAGADAVVLKSSIVTDLLPAVDAIRGGRGSATRAENGRP